MIPGLRHKIGEAAIMMEIYTAMTLRELYHHGLALLAQVVPQAELAGTSTAVTQWWLAETYHVFNPFLSHFSNRQYSRE